MKRRTVPVTTRKLKRSKSKKIEPPEIEPEVEIDAESFHDVITGPEFEPTPVPIQSVHTPTDLGSFHTPMTDAPIKTPIEITEALKEAPTEEEMFVRIFHDYSGFMEFIKTKVCHKPFSTDHFCFCFKKLTPHFFSTGSPPGYSLYTAVDLELVERSDTPFFDSMKIVFSRMPHFKPSIVTENRTTEHLHMIMLDRLIYYYQIYILMKNNQLKGFSNTAGFVIYLHGSYPIYDVSNKKSIKHVKSPTENMFLCTRAAPGCFAYGYPGAILEDFENQDSSLWTMTNNLENKQYVNFDEMAFKPKKYSDDSTMAVCYLSDTKRGRAMEHYIHPNRNKYINKIYQGKCADGLCYVINLEKLNLTRSDPHMKIEDRLAFSNILEEPFIMRRRSNYPDGTFILNLSDIVDYASDVLKKTNVFIYDRSCSVFDHTLVNGEILLPPIEKVITRVEGYTREGFGKSRRKKKGVRKMRKMSKRKKHIVRKTKRRH